MEHNICDKINTEDNYYWFLCPHCAKMIQVLKNQVNCKIFRCGVYKNNMQPIHPHLDKNSCEQLLETGVVYGCTKPFRMDMNNMKVQICGYI